MIERLPEYDTGLFKSLLKLNKLASEQNIIVREIKCGVFGQPKEFYLLGIKCSNTLFRNEII